MRRRRTAGALGAAAVAACLLAACSLRTGPRRGVGEARAPEELRIWIAPIVRWEPGAARAVALSLENATNRTLVIASPDPANARVAVFAGPESTRVCGVEPSEEARAHGRVELAPGDRVAVRVDLGGACAGLPPGGYRYEVSYRAPLPARAEAASEGGAPEPPPFSGTLATSYGEVLVEAEAWPERGPARSPVRAARRPLRGP